jgi:TolC family type I secretion outer membrane protein
MLLKKFEAQRMKKNLICMAIAGLSVTQLQAADLQSELIYLRDNHPMLRATGFALTAAEKRETAAKSGWFPKVDIAAESGPEKITTTPYASGVPSPTPQATDLQRKKQSVTVTQNLFNGGKTLATSNIAKIERQMKDADRSATSQEILLEAITAYLNVLKSQMLINLSAINEETTKRQLDMEKQRVERGGGVIVDELQAATRLQIVRERRVVYEQGMRDAVSSYEQVFSKSPDLKVFQDVDIIKSRMPVSVDSAIEDAETSNPRLLAARLATERTYRLISMENAGFMPNVDLVGTHNRERDAGQLYRKEEDSVLVKMSWNLFSGRETLSRAQAAAYDYRESAEKEKNIGNKTKESVRVAWNQYKKGIERLELLDSAVKTSQGVMRGRKKLRDAGKETALAVLDSEVEHFGLLANKVNAMIDAKMGSYRLLSALGKLDIDSLNLEQGKFEIPVQSLDQAVKALVGDELLIR